MHPTRFTLGYEGLTLEAFITRLQVAQVKTAVDVRELPLSRKKGFSKSAFCAALATNGIAYLHAPALGCPKPIRNQYKADGNWQTYTREFLKYIQTQEASLRELVKIAQATRPVWCVLRRTIPAATASSAQRPGQSPPHSGNAPL